MKPLLSAAICIIALINAATCGAYPLDGYAYKGVARLEAYRLAMEGKVRAPKQPSGALLSIDQVDLRLQAMPDLEIPAADRELYYMVVVMSNVLRKSSAVVHQTLATRIHRTLEKYYKVGKFSSNGSEPDK